MEAVIDDGGWLFFGRFDVFFYFCDGGHQRFFGHEGLEGAGFNFWQFYSLSHPLSKVIYLFLLLENIPKIF